MDIERRVRAGVHKEHTDLICLLSRPTHVDLTHENDILNIMIVEE